MSLRILGVELRRSMALWGGGLLLLSSLLLTYLLPPLMLHGGGAWNKQWTGLAIQPRHLLMFAWPFILGAGAVQGLRDHRSGISELVSSTARPAWQRTSHLLGAVTLGLGGGFGVLLAVGAIQVVGNTSYFHYGWLPIVVVDVLAVVAAAWLGTGIGRALPSVLTAPVLTVAALVGMVMLESAGGAISLLSPALGLRGNLSAFVTLAPSVTVGQLVWFVALAVTGFLLVTTTRKRMRLAALLTVALGAAAAVPLLPSGRAEAFVVDHDATELVCADGSPRVCLTRAHAGRLPELVDPARHALSRLAALPESPTAVAEIPASGRAVESRTTEPRSGRTVPITFGSRATAIPLDPEIEPQEARFTLLLGAGTPACVTESRAHLTRQRVARTVAAAGLAGELRERGEDTQYAYIGEMWQQVNTRSERVWETFRELPTQEQLRRIAALREASLACEGNLLAILTDGAAPR